jgi:hypothetical protein
MVTVSMFLLPSKTYASHLESKSGHATAITPNASAAKAACLRVKAKSWEAHSCSSLLPPRKAVNSR